MLIKSLSTALFIVIMFKSSCPQTTFNPSNEFSFQLNKDTVNSNVTINEKALFDVHLAASLNNGLRIGSRWYLLKYFSGEISYGFNLESFAGIGGHIIGLGINYYPLKKYSVAFNLGWFINIRQDYDFYYIISPNFGFLTSRDKGFRLHVLMGMSIIISKFEGSKFSSTELKPNVEIGFGIGY